jgi:hypothetical protein
MDNAVTNAFIEFAKEHAVALLMASIYYLGAGLLGAILGRRSRIDAWCDANPKLAMVLNFLRGTGFDYWKILTLLKVLFESRATFTNVAKALPFLLVASLGLASQGCSLEAARQARINSALKASAAGATIAARPDAECKRLDDIHVYSMYGAEVAIGMGIGAGAVAQNTHGTVQDVAIATGIGASALALALGYVSGEFKQDWVEQCSK